MKYFKPLLLALLFLTFCATYNPVSAQNIPQNFSNVNVNDLTDAQIQQILQQAQANGLSDTQILQQAENKGMSADQVQLLQKRIATIRAAGGQYFQ